MKKLWKAGIAGAIACTALVGTVCPVSANTPASPVSAQSPASADTNTANSPVSAASPSSAN